MFFLKKRGSFTISASSWDTDLGMLLYEKGGGGGWIFKRDLWVKLGVHLTIFKKEGEHFVYFKKVRGTVPLNNGLVGTQDKVANER